jgi:hypothetical protein
VGVTVVDDQSRTRTRIAAALGLAADSEQRLGRPRSHVFELADLDGWPRVGH